MNEIRPHHVIDRLVPDRSDEVTALREAIAEALAEAEKLAFQVIDARIEATHWKAVAANAALELGRMRRERDAARALACAIAAQDPPNWVEGPDAA